MRQPEGQQAGFQESFYTSEQNEDTYLGLMEDLKEQMHELKSYAHFIKNLEPEERTVEVKDELLDKMDDLDDIQQSIEEVLDEYRMNPRSHIMVNTRERKDRASEYQNLTETVLADLHRELSFVSQLKYEGDDD